ncbi:MAG: (4Fe-4S)-binding protein, partial [Candidatus Ratteibacteria bacterium]
MLNSKKVKEVAKKLGADLVGIASMERFEGAPKQMDPRYINPDAKALIVIGLRIPRGALRGIEEGTYFLSYSSQAYGSINMIYNPFILYHLTRFIEDNGYEATPIPNDYYNWPAIE